MAQQFAKPGDIAAWNTFLSPSKQNINYHVLSSRYKHKQAFDTEMAFHKSSEDIDVIDGFLLATCTDCSGHEQEAQLKLDLYLGNSNGFFEWGGRDFSKTAVACQIIGEDGSSVLHARLEKEDKNWRCAKINLSDRITNVNGKLKYMDKKEPHNTGTREFLGEERDFLSAAISETISDLRELFIDSPLFSNRRHESSGGRQSSSKRRRSGSRDTTGSSISHINMEDSIASTTTSVADSKGDPPSYEKGRDTYGTASNHGSSAPSEKFNNIETKDGQLEKPTTLEQYESNDQEDKILEQVKDFLLKDDGNSVRSFKTENSGRRFELREASGLIRFLHIQGRVLFDQDEDKAPSVSEASDQEYDQCMTPSVVDGEDEYDFLK